MLTHINLNLQKKGVAGSGDISTCREFKPDPRHLPHFSGLCLRFMFIKRNGEEKRVKTEVTVVPSAYMIALHPSVSLEVKVELFYLKSLDTLRIFLCDFDIRWISYFFEECQSFHVKLLCFTKLTLSLCQSTQLPKICCLPS